jgi:hypothetical protein
VQGTGPNIPAHPGDQGENLVNPLFSIIFIARWSAAAHTIALFQYTYKVYTGRMRAAPGAAVEPPLLSR